MIPQSTLLRVMTMIFVVITAHQLGAQGEPPRRACGSEIGYDDIIRYGGEVRTRYEQLERFTQQYIQNLEKGEGKAGFDGERASPIIIPVVVHIVWNTAAENIPDARVIEQIARLNLDYQHLNTDSGSVPAEFSGVATDMQIRFQLAVRDPNCNVTTGITRTNTTQTSFSNPDPTHGTDIAFNPVKSTAAGGIDAWPADRYLNIWVCNFTNPIVLGYSSFPGFPANVDGVVITYKAFGNTSGSFNLGRTATHEIGHYLNLFHPFQRDDPVVPGCYGATDATCGTSGDRVCDTPPTHQANGGCPPLTLNSCTETPTDQHDQWMNFMDYPDDACMYMFTSGQKERVDACLYGARSNLLSSDALIPVASGGTADLWSQDKPDDIGAEPNVTSDSMYVSEDIWVRNDPGIAVQEHLNPVSNTVNHVYVRVRNRVCATTGTATVRLYWAKASPSLSWPAPWDGTIAGPPSMGNEVGTDTVTVAGATAQIAHFTWNTPNLDDYAAMGADAAHFCLLARIETDVAPGFGLANPDGTVGLWNYVANNNNIVWKNVEVVPSAGAPPAGGREAGLVVGNMSKNAMREVKIAFNAPPDDHKVAFTDVGKIRVKLSEQLYALWEEGGKKAGGITTTNDKLTLQVDKPGAYLGGFAFEPGRLASIKLAFEFTKHVPWAVHKLFHVTVDQFAAGPNGTEQRIGGQDFGVRNPKTAADSMQGGVTAACHIHLCWWIIVILIIIIIVLLICLFWRKTKT
jgi:Pregnancy-associated plasma protein-A